MDIRRLSLLYNLASRQVVQVNTTTFTAGPGQGVIDLHPTVCHGALEHPNHYLVNETLDSLVERPDIEQIKAAEQLADAQAVQRAAIKTGWQLEPENGLICSLGFRIHCTREDLSNLNEFIGICERKGIEGTDQFRCHDGTYQIVTLDQMITLRNEMVDWGMALLYHKWALYAQLDAAETVAEVEGIAWSVPEV